MYLFQWTKEDYGLSIPEMDLEHQNLIQLMNKLLKKNSAKASKLELSLIITDLINYVILHFKNEEEYLQKINYPRLEEHKKIHENLLNQLNIYYTNYLKQENELIDNRFFEFLSLWLSSHIQHFDMDYSYFIQSNSTIPTPQQKV